VAYTLLLWARGLRVAWPCNPNNEPHDLSEGKLKSSRGLPTCRFGRLGCIAGVACQLFSGGCSICPHGGVPLG
jgi:hypothetical protein